MSEPADVLARLAAELSEVFDDDLWSLAVHGSWALGDFAPGRSDLDLLAVMATDPTPATLAGLDDVHARLDRDFAEWNGHVEVDYVSAEAIEAVVRGADESHPMIRISPGEPLHEVEASRHYVLNWAAALQADQPIAGAAPFAALRKRWRLDGWCPSWRPPMPAGHGSRNGQRSSTGPKTGGTRADRTQTMGGSKMCADSSTTSARGHYRTTTSCPAPASTRSDSSHRSQPAGALLAITTGRYPGIADELAGRHANPEDLIDLRNHPDERTAPQLPPN